MRSLLHDPVSGGRRRPRPAAAWSQAFGLVGFELFGQFENMISARDEFFDRAVGTLAESIGFAVAEP